MGVITIFIVFWLLISIVVLISDFVNYKCLAKNGVFKNIFYYGFVVPVFLFKEFVVNIFK